MAAIMHCLFRRRAQLGADVTGVGVGGQDDDDDLFEVVNTIHGGVIYPRRTLNIFRLMLTRLSRRCQELKDTAYRNVLYANYVALFNRYKIYREQDLLRRQSPTYGFSQEIMVDIEEQLYEYLIGFVNFQVISIKNASSDTQFVMTIDHGSKSSTLTFLLKHGTWIVIYGIKDDKKDHTRLKLNPARLNIKVEMSKNVSLFNLFKVRRLSQGLPRHIDIRDVLCTTAIHDLTFDEVVVRFKSVWQPYDWYKVGKAAKQPEKSGKSDDLPAPVPMEH